MIPRRSGGFTLIEVLTVLMVTATIIATLAPQWNAAFRRVQLKRLVDESTLVANAAKIHSRRVQSATITAGAPTTYTYYANGGAFVTAAALNTALGTRLPEKNPWGEDYEAFADSRIAYARTKVPLPATTVTGSFIRGEVIDANNSYAIVDAMVPMGVRAAEMRPRMIRASGYGEAVR